MLNRQNLLSFLVLSISIFWGLFVYAEDNNGDLLKSIERDLYKNSEEIEVKMTILEPDGTVRERQILIMKKNEKDQQSLIKTLAPADLMSTSLLTTVTNDTLVTQWHYVPAEKHAREVKGILRKTRFLDSEFNLEDLSLAFYRNCSHRLLETLNEGTKTILVFDSIPLNIKDSSYSHIKTWVDATHKYLQKAEYYDADNTLIKTITFNNHKNIDNQWRAQNVVMKNVKKNRSTQLDVNKITVKKFSENEFSPKIFENRKE